MVRVRVQAQDNYADENHEADKKQSDSLEQIKKHIFCIERPKKLMRGKHK